MTNFVVIEDYTECEVWDGLICRLVPTLPSKPKGWDRDKGSSLPEGEWTLACGLHQMATAGAYAGAGITKPRFEQLPAVFCVAENGAVVSRFNVDTPEKVLAFIKENLGVV